MAGFVKAQGSSAQLGQKSCLRLLAELGGAALYFGKKRGGYSGAGVGFRTPDFVSLYSSSAARRALATGVPSLGKQ